MNNLKLNETPVRTSRSFNINNIKLQDIVIPEDIEVFKNANITSGSFAVADYKESIDLSYGLGDKLQEQSNTKSNFSKIISNTKNEEITIVFNLSKEDPNLVEKLYFKVKENTKMKVIIKYVSADNLYCYHNGIVKAIVEKNANLDITIVNFLNEKSSNFLSVENTIENNGKADYKVVDFGGKVSITNYYSNVKGVEADSKINTIYIGKENQLIDLNYICNLYGEKSNVDMEVQGSLNDSAVKHFKGTIDFKKGAKKATGNENENCILLSDKAKSLALPMLLCSEEDVEGNHSSSAGKINPKELFYIMTRGFSLKEAQKLMVKAKFNQVIKKIDNDDLKQEIINEIDKRLS